MNCLLIGVVPTVVGDGLFGKLLGYRFSGSCEGLSFYTANASHPVLRAGRALRTTCDQTTERGTNTE